MTYRVRNQAPLLYMLLTIALIAILYFYIADRNVATIAQDSSTRGITLLLNIFLYSCFTYFFTLIVFFHFKAKKSSGTQIVISKLDITLPNADSLFFPWQKSEYDLKYSDIKAVVNSDLKLYGTIIRRITIQTMNGKSLHITEKMFKDNQFDDFITVLSKKLQS
ncbi:MAG: hypothetical protein COW00_03970 [Bdellovibrio sp. CG12_big_fil_rev_8_21_14_0_65_39_13]|nr:MAG: hypothetical protein COW78_16070 [Bdellovibrio sp. CG22_combo_CG10-13_8_21_14_all_39_27]PIQ61389.1 MAG: hypothetical protein COW00_03970 [Bdellovibrio sp. CG12_big_fil_rev_8_21_14_0_65_39_13]PIR33205.1 MAG: hypothetical protein COV37_17320 [Bdellovibrio sp. CG11_big_fil_rev_8_21_14_0_20_39_38]